MISKAWSRLALACFLHKDVDMIAPEGCHFFAQTVAAVRSGTKPLCEGELVAYVALAQACTDNAQSVYEEAKALYRKGAAQHASWIKSCDALIRTRQTFAPCQAMAQSGVD